MRSPRSILTDAIAAIALQRLLVQRGGNKADAISRADARGLTTQSKTQLKSQMLSDELEKCYAVGTDPRDGASDPAYTGNSPTSR